MVATEVKFHNWGSAETAFLLKIVCEIKHFECFIKFKQIKKS